MAYTFYPNKYCSTRGLKSFEIYKIFPEWWFLIQPSLKCPRLSAKFPDRKLQGLIHLSTESIKNMDAEKISFVYWSSEMPLIINIIICRIFLETTSAPSPFTSTTVFPFLLIFQPNEFRFPRREFYESVQKSGWNYLPCFNIFFNVSHLIIEIFR